MSLTELITQLEYSLNYKYLKTDIAKTLLVTNGETRQKWAFLGDKLLGTWHAMWIVKTLGFEAVKDSEYKLLITNRALRGFAVHYDVIYVNSFSNAISKKANKNNLKITDVNETKIGTYVEACIYSIYVDSDFRTGYEWIKMNYFNNEAAREAALRSYKNKSVVSRRLLPRALAKSNE